MNFNDQTLTRPFSKHFKAVTADTVEPRLNNWVVTDPLAGTKEPLKIIFNDRLDYISAQTLISITTENNIPVEGEMVLQANESESIYVPKHFWKAGKYKIRVASNLEDLAANSLNGRFDHQRGTLKKQLETYIEEIIFYIK